MAKTYEYKGNTYTISQLAGIAPNHISADSLRARINFGMDIATAITKPIRSKGGQHLMSCGAKDWHDCLSCPFATCIAISEPAMPGEAGGEYA